MIFGIIGAILLAVVVFIGVLVYRKQKELDIPVSGTLVVEKIRGEPSLVYSKFGKDPGAFTDGEVIKLHVRVLEDIRKDNKGPYGSK